MSDYPQAIGPGVVALMYGVTDTPPGSVTGMSIRVSVDWQDRPLLMLGTTCVRITDPATLDDLITALTDARSYLTREGVHGTVVQQDERGLGPFHGVPYHICGKPFVEDGETFECTDDHGHDGPCNQ